MDGFFGPDSFGDGFMTPPPAVGGSHGTDFTQASNSEFVPILQGF